MSQKIPLLLALACMGSVAIADSAHRDDRRVIRLDSRATAINSFVDLNEPGPSTGDIYIFVDDLFRTDSAIQVGQATGRCNLIDPAIGSFECTTISSLAGGTITTNGILYNVPGVISVGSITGGTGVFRGATGEASLDLGPPEGPHRVVFVLDKK